MISDRDVQFYRDNGYLVVENVFSADEVAALRADTEAMVAKAAEVTANNDIYDLEDSHSPDQPRIRRIKLPHRISPVMNDLLRSDHILAPVRDLVGPDVRLHTTKLNLKSAGYGAAIEWHQDFAFYPHTNDDVLAVGVLIDDMVEENGPLMVFPGTHKGEIFDHHANGVFAGAMDLAANGLDMGRAVQLTGPAGSISIHHGHIVHGSALNTSARDRRMLFYEMMAADAFPVMGSMTKFDSIEEYDARMLCGQPTLTPRLKDVSVRIPQPQPALNRSIYEIQKNTAKPAFARAT